MTKTLLTLAILFPACTPCPEVPGVHKITCDGEMLLPRGVDGEVYIVTNKGKSWCVLRVEDDTPIDGYHGVFQIPEKVTLYKLGQWRVFTPND